MNGVLFHRRHFLRQMSLIPFASAVSNATLLAQRKPSPATSGPVIDTTAARCAERLKKAFVSSRASRTAPAPLVRAGSCLQESPHSGPGFGELRRLDTPRRRLSGPAYTITSKLSIG
jgi:hypothetical protein